MNGALVQLWWLPVGAGGHIVVHTSRWWEYFSALRERRPEQPLFHSALIVVHSDKEYVIEMAPAWGRHSRSRGVVAVGPVVLHSLGHFRLFRYEVRCWPSGVLPDRRYAVESPVVFPLSSAAAAGLLSRTRAVPPHVWGRPVPGSPDTAGPADMWNSNSLTSWLLQGAGIDAVPIVPPHGGRAPGWAAGIAASRA